MVAEMRPTAESPPINKPPQTGREQHSDRLNNIVSMNKRLPLYCIAIARNAIKAGKKSKLPGINQTEYLTAANSVGVGCLNLCQLYNGVSPARSQNIYFIFFTLSQVRHQLIGFLFKKEPCCFYRANRHLSAFKQIRRKVS